MRNLKVAVAALFLGVSLASPVFAPAAASARPYASSDGCDDDGQKATNAGTVTGVVTRVDYQKGRITLAGPKGDVEVTVLPSTTIQGKAGFSEISDIVKGQHLKVFLSKKGDEKFAQIIQLQS